MIFVLIGVMSVRDVNLRMFGPAGSRFGLQGH